MDLNHDKDRFAEALASRLTLELPLLFRQTAKFKRLILDFCNQQHVAVFVTPEPPAPRHIHQRAAELWRELTEAEAAQQETRIATSAGENDVLIYANGIAAQHLLAMLTALDQVSGELLLNRAPKA